jgi:multidrug resistance protein MdtO
MASQIFLLPSIDSIAGFTALFIPVIAAAAWVATSSPRLAYLGVQVAVGFCLINLQEFSFNTSLTTARDRAAGIFLGLLMMWVFFDRLWSTPAGVLMRTEFISTLRLLALLAREPVSNDVQVAIERSHALRERISSQLDRVRTLTDAVLFEFGASRRRDLAFRDRVRQWGPQLRTLAIIRIAALKYELQVPGFDVPDAVRLRQWAYDEFSAGMLDQVADRLEGREPSGTPERGELQKSSAEALDNLEAEASRELPTAKAQSLITLLRAIDDLTTRVWKQMATDFAGVV